MRLLQILNQKKYFYNFRSMADIWKDVHHAIQYMAVVFEDTNTDLGMQVGIHLWYSFKLWHPSFWTRGLTVFVSYIL